MKSKEKIIIEETGCDEEQAKLSLKESGDNLQKAMKTIASTLKCITVIKSKFICEDINIYGLFAMIVNLRKESIIRSAAVVANNPAIYENDMELKWHIFEKQLYALRLHEGSLQETTSKFEQDLSRKIKKNYKQAFFQLVREKKVDELSELLKSAVSGALSDSGVRMKLQIEELTLNQFRKLSDESISITENKSNGNDYNREITLESELVEDDGEHGSIEADKLRINDNVLTCITDNRDIAQYLSRLLGGRKRDSIIPLNAMVEKIRYEGNTLIVDTRFGPGIIGRAQVNRKIRIKIVKDVQERIARQRRIFWFLFVLAALIGMAYTILSMVIK